MTHSTNMICNYEIKRDFDVSNNKEVNLLIINCEKCIFSNIDKNSKFYESNCFKNLIKIFRDNPKIIKLALKTINGVLELTDSQIEIFSEYAAILVQSLKVKFPSLIQKDDCSKSNECKNSQNFFLERILGNKFNDGLIISNPILFYKEIIQEIKIYNQVSIERKQCKDCLGSFNHFLSEIRDLLVQSKIIKSYLNFEHKNKEYSEIYSIIFGDLNLKIDYPKENSNLSNFNEIIRTSYKKGPYKIKIIENPGCSEYFYNISSIIEEPAFNDVYVLLIQEIKSNPKKFFDYQRPHKLIYLLQYEKQFINLLIKQRYPQFSDGEMSDISELIVFELLNLNPLMALLIDDEIEEIFLDSPQSFIYLDHRQFGRCQTRIKLTSNEIDSLKTRIRIEAEQRLDEMHPFLKTEVITDSFHIRITIQIYPLSTDRFSMNIRKLHKNFFTIIDLIKNNTISIEAATYLIFNLIHGRCILVIGEPYSGKTTLINSLDLMGKKTWRKIYIEDIIESIDQSAFGIHQIRFQVNPNEENSENFLDKSFQVKECLHRTPDEVFIGELIHPKSVESFFFLIKVGLRRCLATAHGESPELMVKRFIYDDRIPVSMIENLDIIVQMNRINFAGRILRRVTRISEIKKEKEPNCNKKISMKNLNNLPDFLDIFLRDPETDQLLSNFSSLNEIYEKSDIIQRIISIRSENLTSSDFINEILKIQNNLEEILKSDMQGAEKMIFNFQNLWQELESKN